jgi:hypothetical protein
MEPDMNAVGRFVYIAHRLSGDWEANIADARLWVKAALDGGYVPVAPYLMTEGILHEPEDREVGLELDEAFIGRCDELWLCGEIISEGMNREAATAANLGLLVRHVHTMGDI